MNAFTASDWTAYPFATQNKKDFFNLLDVYLDAVYFPLLEEDDFKQEGHRLEFSKLDKSSSDLEYKGVVFNEMKGSMSNISNTTWQACQVVFEILLIDPFISLKTTPLYSRSLLLLSSFENSNL